VSTWVDVIADYVLRPRIKWSPGPKSLLAWAGARGDGAGAEALVRTAVQPVGGRSCLGSTLGAMRRHSDQGALSTPGGVHRKGDLVGETGNPLVGARARPEGKIVSVTIAGRAGDPLY
jgi:hypothetical protein